MTTPNGNIPPGTGRLRAAAAQGVFSHSELLITGLVLVAGAGALVFFAPSWALELKHFTTETLATALRGEMDIATVMNELGRQLLNLLLPFPALVAAIACVGALWPALRAKQGRGQTAIPLPSAPRTTFTTIVLRTFCATVAVLVALQVLLAHRASLIAVIQREQTPFDAFLAAALPALAAAGCVCIIGGLVELALARHAIFHSLHLSPSDSKREQRNADGDSSARAEFKRRQRQERLR